MVPQEIFEPEFHHLQENIGAWIQASISVLDICRREVCASFNSAAPVQVVQPDSPPHSKQSNLRRALIIDELCLGVHKRTVRSVTQGRLAAGLNSRPSGV
jgi:hypothetical protein